MRMWEKEKEVREAGIEEKICHHQSCAVSCETVEMTVSVTMTSLAFVFRPGCSKLFCYCAENNAFHDASLSSPFKSSRIIAMCTVRFFCRAHWLKSLECPESYPTTCDLRIGRGQFLYLPGCQCFEIV